MPTKKQVQSAIEKIKANGFPKKRFKGPKINTSKNFDGVLIFNREHHKESTLYLSRLCRLKSQENRRKDQHIDEVLIGFADGSVGGMGTKLGISVCICYGEKDENGNPKIYILDGDHTSGAMLKMADCLFHILDELHPDWEIILPLNVFEDNKKPEVLQLWTGFDTKVMRRDRSQRFAILLEEGQPYHTFQTGSIKTDNKHMCKWIQAVGQFQHAEAHPKSPMKQCCRDDDETIFEEIRLGSKDPNNPYHLSFMKILRDVGYARKGKAAQKASVRAAVAKVMHQYRLNRPGVSYEVCRQFLCGEGGILEADRNLSSWLDNANRFVANKTPNQNADTIYNGTVEALQNAIKNQKNRR